MFERFIGYGYNNGDSRCVGPTALCGARAAWDFLFTRASRLPRVVVAREDGTVLAEVVNGRLSLTPEGSDALKGRSALGAAR